jgi:hypothetical protein
MTDIDVIEKILKSSKPSDLFTDGEHKKIYIQYSKLIHPDVCSNKSAGEAMAKMNYFKDIIENGTPFVDESGPFRVFEKKIVYVVTDAVHQCSLCSHPFSAISWEQACSALQSCNLWL